MTGIRLLRRREVVTDFEGTVTLDYYLVDTGTDQGEKSERHYGIQIATYKSMDDYLEIESIRDVSPDRDEVTGLIESFADGTVTPMLLRDTLEEYYAARQTVLV